MILPSEFQPRTATAGIVERRSVLKSLCLLVSRDRCSHCLLVAFSCPYTGGHELNTHLYGTNAKRICRATVTEILEMGQTDVWPQAQACGNGISQPVRA